MRRLDRRTRVAVAAALLAPAVLLGGVATASAAPTSPAVTNDDSPGGQWWDSGSGFDNRGDRQDAGRGARDGDPAGSSQYDDGDSDEAMDDGGRRMPGSDHSDAAAQRYANEVGFAPEKASKNERRRPGRSMDDPQSQTESAPEQRAQDPAGLDDSGARDGEAATREGTEGGAKADKSDEKAADPDKFSVETPQKNFDEGAERVRRGRNSDVPKPGQTDKAPAAAKKAAPKKSVSKKAAKDGSDNKAKVRAKAKGKKP